MIIPPFIAHRGASQLAPENTLKAFQLAEQLGAKMFECDVLLSQDAIPMIFHDDTLERCTNGQGEIRETPAALLKNLDAGQGQSIPSLQELLSWFATAKLRMNLELKYAKNTDRPEPLVSQVCKQIQACQGRILISSFNLDALYRLRQILPEITIGLLIDAENWQRHGLQGITKIYQELQAYSIHCDRHLLTREHIQALLKISPHLLAYTVNQAKQAKKLFAQGVTGVFTDTLC